MLKINHLSCIKPGKEILKGLSLNIPKNRVTLLLGKSGSGKTTLLRCIAQLETQYQGEISFLGQSINKLSPKQRCQIIGYISQSYPLYPHMNVLDNCANALMVILGTKKQEAYGQVRKILSLFEIENLSLSMPSCLSGGQRQRVAIARAMALHPSFLLFDEPTSALDPENRELFIQVVRNLLKAGTGVIISSHDMNLASRLLDIAYFLEDGRFLECYDAEKEESILSKEKMRIFLT
jgi:ABC-type polar amino acid transport system ATPase subunit